ncbi:hypothetical protein H8R18_08230 [Nanchangia anserum]|uniref:Late embryogenesis abundant protein n=1 Tax=Nanchangia anserum TaxID=2692125 RepID=A0A8I0GC12_9ACTO|nr:hypothetical protein [Nanchangia anserum]MBD3689506.1 hypothetical protein [Nanchangia anserum]QOX81695.1 hypothetical protein H8R18_08230 [Nanchangia anserum]
MGIPALLRAACGTQCLVKASKRYVAPRVDQLHDQVNLWTPRVVDAAQQVKQRIVEEAPVKAEVAKEKAATIVENSAMLQGAKQDALAVKDQLTNRAAQVTAQAADTAQSLSKQASKQADQAASRVADASKKASKASKKASKRASKRADKLAKRAGKAASKVERQANTRKSHRGLKFFLLVGPLLAVAGVAALLYRRSQPIEDPWAEEYWEDVDFRGGGCCAGKKADEAADKAGEVAADAADAAKDKADEVADKAQGLADKAAEKIGDAADKANDVAKKGAEKLDK